MRRFVLMATVICCSCTEAKQDGPPPDATPRCGALELTAADGSCVRPGVPPDGCAEGFVHDGAYGCSPVLPVDACPAGRIAVPGDHACRPVLECGEGKWGDIPVDASTHYVDASYAGGDSDGTADKPWTSIQQGLDAAPGGALVAVAEGSYVEDVVVWNKAAKLWGVCPDRVEVVGAGIEPSAIIVAYSLAGGSEIHGIAVRGPNAGVVVSGAQNVLLDRVWVHDTGERCVSVQETYGASSLRIVGSLFEQCLILGVHVSGSTVAVEQSAVRRTLPYPVDHTGGWGITAQDCWPEEGCTTAVRANVSIVQSLVDQSHDMGVYVSGSDFVMERSVVRSTRAEANGSLGRGVAIQLGCLPSYCDPTARAQATVRGSLIEESHDVGISLIGSDIIIETTTVRSTAPQPSTGLSGRGINIQACEASILPCATPVSALATITSSLVAQSHDVGLMIIDADAAVSRTVVRDTVTRQLDGLFGDGIAVVSEVLPTRGELAAVRIEQTARAGVSSFGAVVGLDTLAIRCAAIDVAGEAGPLSNFTFDDHGGNACGCPSEQGSCSAVSVGLEPPSAIGPAQ